MSSSTISRRGLVGGGLGLAALGALPAWARSQTPGLAAAGGAPGDTLSGPDIRLSIGHRGFTLGRRTGHAVTVNGSLPAPLIRLREGQEAVIHVTNTLDEDSSIHWHGLLLPFQMDGVPGISFPGIRPGETFSYRFPVRQAGTYWYHSHSGHQEQAGLYGPLVIDPAGADPIASDREHVLVLSDWTFLHPHRLMARLRAGHGAFNRQKMTVAGRLSGDPEHRMPAADRRMFAEMRMDPTDILDVNGSVYTYLVNGRAPGDCWTGAFAPGERVRLRIVNAGAMSIFNLRIPGLAMTVVAADGIPVRPVEVDELQIAAAETYDVVVTPAAEPAYTIVAEAMDRSGLGIARLVSRPGATAPVPALRDRPVLDMADMGMGGMGGMDHGAGHGGAHGGGHAMDHDMRDGSRAPGVRLGPGVDMIAPMPVDRTGSPGVGLEDVGHRVLTYRDLRSLVPGTDRRPPTRTLEVHLTGNMERFMWSFDGVALSETPEPLRFERDERVRMRLVNDTMMAHPIHIHGHFWELVNGQDGHHPLKHTVNVQPGGTVDLDLTADAPGDWAFHCHLLLHMHAGMMRVVTVRPMDGAAA